MDNLLPTAALWAISGFLLTLFAVFAGINAIYLLGQFRSRFEYGPSLLPFFGGFFGLLGILLMPVAGLPDRLVWCWIPLMLDTGSAPYIAIGIYFSLKNRRTP